MPPTWHMLLILLCRFQVVNLVAFKPFKSAVEALEQVNAVSEGVATTELLDFLEANLPKVRSLTVNL